MATRMRIKYNAWHREGKPQNIVEDGEVEPLHQEYWDEQRKEEERYYDTADWIMHYNTVGNDEDWGVSEMSMEGEGRERKRRMEESGLNKRKRRVHTENLQQSYMRETDQMGDFARE